MKNILSRIKFLYVILDLIITAGFGLIVLYFNLNNTRPIRRAWASKRLKKHGIKLETFGELDLDAQLLIINHQSLLDILIYEAVHPKDIAWVAKKEIADIPWLGNMLKFPKMIIIDRADKAGLVKLIREAKDRLDKKRPIIIFPEGTRGKGDKLLKFKQGAKIVAEKYNLKVQPIILTNTRNLINTHDYKFNPGVVGVHYLESFYPIEEDWYKTTYENMNKVFIDAMANNSSNR